MILHINERINADSVEKLINFINQVLQNDTHGTIYLYSFGGLTEHSECMTDVINKNKDRVTLIGYGKLCSAAFDLFFQVNCKKELLDGTLGMYHQSQISVDINENLKGVYHESEAQMEYLRTYLKAFTENQMDALEFTDKEKRRIKSGKDVWFSHKRMKEFLSVNLSKNRILV